MGYDLSLTSAPPIEPISRVSMRRSKGMDHSHPRRPQQRFFRISSEQAVEVTAYWGRGSATRTGGKILVRGETAGI